MANLKSTTVSDTGFLQLPSGTTGERPASPAAGEIRFNTDTKVCEWYDDQLAAWFPTGTVPPVATGGDTVEDVDINGVTYRIHSFTTVGESTFTVTRGGPVDYLIVAGGGAGGVPDRAGGGGGAGGLLTGTTSIVIGNYKIKVGAGAIADNNSGASAVNGENSNALGFTTLGGGGGANQDERSDTLIAASGGSGGGGNDGENSIKSDSVFPRGSNPGAAGTPGQGNSGGFGAHRGGDWAHGGGGGGAGEPGGNSDTSGVDSSAGARPGPGGNGIASQITGTVQFYAGGGAGGGWSSTVGEAGGLGGGGDSKGGSQTGKGGSGEPNTGGGGGGAGGSGSEGGDGGSGIVIIRYRIS